MKMSIQTGLAALAVTFMAAEAAAVQGVITMPNNSKREVDIKWIVRDKAYSITEKGRPIEMQLKPDEIADLQIPRPRELDAAIESIRQGNAAAAVPVLEKLAADYLMLQWDKPATRYLAEAHVQAGNADKAIAVCEKVIAANPEAAYLGEMAPAYWQALIKRDRLSKVEDLLSKAIKTGDRLASANALIARGDLVQAAGDTAEIAKKALRDGYLRVITLYKSERAAQPEALFKAAKCFEKLGQTQRADQLRTTLKGEFGSSEWAKK
ncbi:MAG: tetratricopeptide repeat protein [Kiritimatiellae bacterium]|nr:tetratricopeptide repeat protein [Kiritimatiellia bacterium]MDD4441290.1 tetratricopeptide repeat protein [Kiritimatiellia bacterium]